MSSNEPNIMHIGNEGQNGQVNESDDQLADVATGETITPERRSQIRALRSGNSQIAGLVGMFTGLGALVALGLFLPLPARLRSVTDSPAQSVKLSFYIVAAVSFAVAILCFFGLRSLSGESEKGIKSIKRQRRQDLPPLYTQQVDDATPSLLGPGLDALALGFADVDIGLGYVGGFVARASSVAISSFIPLYINAYFIATGLCKEEPHSSPADMKEQCQRAYKLAAALTGVSQLSALLFAPIFGYVDGKYHRYNIPLLIAASVGIVGYIALATTTNPDPKDERGGPLIFATMVLLGVSQIGAIVCSLSVLARGIQKNDTQIIPAGDEQQAIESSDGLAQARGGRVHQEHDPLLRRDRSSQASERHSIVRTREQAKGSVAGVYSFAGGAGILLLTKLGGYLFDKSSNGAPFYVMALFNAVLLLVGAAVSCRRSIARQT